MLAFDPYNLIASLIISFAIQIVFFILAATFKTDKVTDLSYGLTFILLAILLLFTNQTFFADLCLGDPAGRLSVHSHIKYRERFPL